MNYSLVIKPAAEIDIQDCYQYYEGYKPGLGSEFVRAVDVCISRIGRNPNAYTIVHKDIRRALMRRFPYGVFYVVTGDKIFVIACFHTKRNPKDWSARS